MSPGQAVGLSIGLFVAMVVCLEIGYRHGGRESAKGGSERGVGVIEAAVFALLGLLLGFSFAIASARFDARHGLIVREANTISTAYLRLDLLSAEDQPRTHGLMREYLDARLAYHNNLSDPAVMTREIDHARRVQQQLWSESVAACRKDASGATAGLLLPALNDMFGLVTDRAAAREGQLPPLILVLLVGVSLLSALLAGHAMSERKSHLHLIIYAVVISVTTYTVIDLDNPRSGLIKLDAADRALTQLRDAIR